MYKYMIQVNPMEVEQFLVVLCSKARISEINTGATSNI